MLAPCLSDLAAQMPRGLMGLLETSDQARFLQVLATAPIPDAAFVRSDDDAIAGILLCALKTHFDDISDKYTADTLRRCWSDVWDAALLGQEFRRALRRAN